MKKKNDSKTDEQDDEFSAARDLLVRELLGGKAARGKVFGGGGALQDTGAFWYGFISNLML